VAVGLGAAEREALAELLGQIVLDNGVPPVFLELAEEADQHH
jgi:hypothetical protein